MSRTSVVGLYQCQELVLWDYISVEGHACIVGLNQCRGLCQCCGVISVSRAMLVLWGYISVEGNASVVGLYQY